MAHFTYADEIDSSGLLQGDVLRRTPEIEEILQEVHPHYHSSPSYRFFIVLTQTCDLVRRHVGNTACKSRYITIAAVRPLRLVVEREIERLMSQRVFDLKLGVSDDRTRTSASSFVERLLNNNEDEFFYLAPESSAGLTEDCCAFLRLSIALKSDLHYDKLLAAKILQLKVEFQHKLGFHVGKSYSRVATEDWVPSAGSQKDFNARVVSIVGNALSNYQILDKRRYDKIIKKAQGYGVIDDPSAVLNQFIADIEKERTDSRNRLFDEIRGILAKLGVPPESLNRSRPVFESNPVFAALLKRGLE